MQWANKTYVKQINFTDGRRPDSIVAFKTISGFPEIKEWYSYFCQTMYEFNAKKLCGENELKFYDPQNLTKYTSLFNYTSDNGAQDVSNSSLFNIKTMKLILELGSETSNIISGPAGKQVPIANVFKSNHTAW